MLPWRYRAKPLGVGRQWLILFLCVVLCVVCVCDGVYLSILGGEITVDFFVASLEIIGRISRKKITRSVQLKLKFNLIKS
jgi:hypothetical protein